MRTLAFDGRMGASGDMILASLLDAGADPEALRPVEATLDVRYERGSVRKAGIAATTVDVLLQETSAAGDDAEDAPGGGEEGHSDGDHAHDEDHSHDGDHAHDEDHSHDGDHAHDEDHSHDEVHSHEDHAPGGHSHESDHARGDSPDGDGTHRHAEGRGPHRTLAEVHEVLDEMDVPAPVRREAGAIFDRLAAAEAAVHGTDPAETHFHEVGADDAIADVVGACLLLADLAPDRVVTTPLSVGGGEVTMSHGTYPVPAPAVMELAGGADWSVRGGPVDRELLTPTGAAILAHAADGVDGLPALRVESTGYGAGGYDLPDRPNVLRTVVGDGGSRLDRDEITVLETNLDDASPEVLGDLQRSLSTVGARDVTILPATMKKSRPGHLVKVIVKPEDAARVARKLAEETGTLGVREHGAGHRWVARRRMETVELDLEGTTVAVAVKVATDESGTVVDVSAEYDDAADAASETSLPVREVMRRAENRVADRVWSTDDE